MKRYLPSSRTSSNLRTNTALGDQFIRDLTLQAQGIMQELAAQFSSDLQAQASQILQDQLISSIGQNGGTSAASGNGDGDNDAGTFGSISQLLSTGVRYLVSRPRTSHSSVETSRSIDAAHFRVSSGQMTAEAQQALDKGSKNL